MSAAVALFLKHWRWAAIGVLVALLGVQSVRLSHAKHDLASARGALVNPATHKTWQRDYEAAARDLKTCHGNVSELDAALKTQGEAVAALKSDSDRRGQMLADALQSARKTAKDAQQRADRLATYQPKGADVCAKLLDLDKELAK